MVRHGALLLPSPTHTTHLTTINTTRSSLSLYFEEHHSTCTTSYRDVRGGLLEKCGPVQEHKASVGGGVERKAPQRYPDAIFGHTHGRVDTVVDLCYVCVACRV